MSDNEDSDHNEEDGAGLTTQSQSKPKSIVVMELPTELANRELLEAHFGQYGTIQKMTCSAKHHYAVILFNSHEEAVRARTDGRVIDEKYGPTKIYLSNKTPSGTPAAMVPSNPSQIKRRHSKTSLNSPMKLIYRARKMSSPEDKSGLEKKSVLSKIQSQKSLKTNTIPTRKKNPFAFVSAAAVNTINKTLQQSLASISDTKPIAQPLIMNLNLLLSGEDSSPNKVKDKPPVASSISHARLSPQKHIKKAPYDLLNFNPDTNEAQELFNKKYVTAEERYRALESRDKLLRARIPKIKVSVEFAKKLFGTCPDMCPEKERYMRQYQRQLTSYEVLGGQSDQIVDHPKAIKAYSRSSADQEEPLPHELRPASTLNLTMDYLLHNIVPIQQQDEEQLGDWYNFLWDRTRSIRKDITQQQLTSLESVGLMEKCARFHIHCSSRLCELDVHSFEPKLNDENLMKCLQSLEHLYDDLRKKNINCPNEPEFRAYQIMMHLNEGDILSDVQQRPDWILRSNQVQFALKIHHNVFQKNFVAFFRMVKSSPYMVSCILHRYFYQMRSRALKSLWKSHSCPPKNEVMMSLPTVQRMLGYGNQTAGFRHFCESHRIIWDLENDRLVLNRRTYSTPESRIVSRENYLIESKLFTSVEEAINGIPLGQNPLLTYIPHSSFNDEGRLIGGSISGGSTEDSSLFPSITSVPRLPQQTTNVLSKKSLLGGIGTSNTSNSIFNTSDNLPSGSTSTSANPFLNLVAEPSKSVFPSSSFKPSTIYPSNTTRFAVGSSSFFNQGISSDTQNVFGGAGTFHQSPQNDVFRVPDLPKSKPPTEQEIIQQKDEYLTELSSNTMKRIFEKVMNQQLIKITMEAREAFESEKKIQLRLEAEEKILNELSSEYAQRIAARCIPLLVAEVGREEIHKERVLQELYNKAAKQLILMTTDKMTVLIAKGAIWEMLAKQNETISKLKDIFNRIKLRMIVKTWIKFVKVKKYRRKKEEDKVLRDRIEFPAANASHGSKKQFLNALVGSNQRSPRLNKISGKNTTQWLDLYERINNMTKDYTSSLQSIAEDIVTPRPQSNLALESSTPKFRSDHINHCWKRRWNNIDEQEILTEKLGSRGLKSRREEAEFMESSNTIATNDLQQGACSPISIVSTSSSLSPTAKSLLEDMNAFVKEIREEAILSESSIIIEPTDIGLDEKVIKNGSRYNNIFSKSEPNVFMESFPDFSAPTSSLSDFENVLKEVEVYQASNSISLLDNLKRFIAEAREEKNKTLILDPDDLQLN